MCKKFWNLCIREGWGEPTSQRLDCCKRSAFNNTEESPADRITGGNIDSNGLVDEDAVGNYSTGHAGYTVGLHPYSGLFDGANFKVATCSGYGMGICKFHSEKQE